MTQNVLQAFFDPTQIRRRAVIARCFQALEQVGHALLEMGECGCVIVADRHSVDPIGQRPQCAFELFGVLGCTRPRMAFQRGGERRDPLFEHRERVAVVAGARELVDLGR